LPLTVTPPIAPVLMFPSIVTAADKDPEKKFASTREEPPIRTFNLVLKLVNSWRPAVVMVVGLHSSIAAPLAASNPNLLPETTVQ